MFLIAPWLIVIIIIAAAAFLAVSIIWGIRAHRTQATTGREELAGKTAVVREALEPEGTVFFDGELWKAVAKKGRINSGEEVVITKFEGLKLWVNKK